MDVCGTGTRVHTCTGTRVPTVPLEYGHIDKPGEIFHDMAMIAYLGMRVGRALPKKGYNDFCTWSLFFWNFIGLQLSNLRCFPQNPGYLYRYRYWYTCVLGLGLGLALSLTLALDIDVLVFVRL